MKSETMKAVQYREYGSPEVLKVEEAPIPKIGRRQVLVKVKAVGLNPKDSAIRYGKLKFITGKNFPKKTGFDFAGEVEALGPGSFAVEPGQRVFGYLTGIRGGAAAEYLNVQENELSVLPPSLSFAEAAAMPCTYLTALQGLRDYAKLQEGERIILFGASGGVGTAAIQIAKLMGAYVTSVSSSRNLDYCRQMGADEAISYEDTDIFQVDKKYNVFLQIYLGGGSRYKKACNILEKNGRFLTLDPKPGAQLHALLTRLTPWRPNAHSVVVQSKTVDLQLLALWVEEGLLQPHIEKRFPLEKMQEAYKLLDTHHVQGKVVLEL